MWARKTCYVYGGTVYYTCASVQQPNPWPTINIAQTTEWQICMQVLALIDPTETIFEQFTEPEPVDLSTVRFVLHACAKIRGMNAILRGIDSVELRQQHTFARPVSMVCKDMEVDGNTVRIFRVTNMWLNAIQKLQKYLDTISRNGYSPIVGTTLVVTTAYEDFCDLDSFIAYTYTTVDPSVDIRTTKSFQVLQTYNEHAAYLTKLCSVVRDFSERHRAGDGDSL